MLKKILTGAILLGLLFAGSLIAEESKEIYGLILTLVDKDNDPITYQLVKCEREQLEENYILTTNTQMILV
ncbi:MAG: hypothetical protein H8D22_04560 [Candidatus Cloacimonetes bacterium]|nr:hypothetical protein [Candidatus Cloacimonadota bacterium]